VIVIHQFPKTKRLQGIIIHQTNDFGAVGGFFGDFMGNWSTAKPNGMSPKALLIRQNRRREIVRPFDFITRALKQDLCFFAETSQELSPKDCFTRFFPYVS
jgi:hypothetical protein